MAVSPASVRLYWQVVDLFRDDPGPWTFGWAQWSIRTAGPAGLGALQLTVSLECGSAGAEPCAAAAAVDARGDAAALLSPSTGRELSRLAHHLAHHGYEVAAPEGFGPVVGHKPLPPRAFASERRFLAELVGADAGAVGGRPGSTREFVDAFRGDAAGAWSPQVASWEWRRPIRLAGRDAVAGLMIHLAPADVEGRRLGAASSITLWPPWTGRGAFPGWLAKAKRTVDRQFRAAGHAPEWHRGPDGRGVMVTSFNEDLRALRTIAAERRRLEAMPLGDER